MNLRPNTLDIQDQTTNSDDEHYIVNLVERITHGSVETIAVVNSQPSLG